MYDFGIAQIVFEFFFFAVSGWVCETIMESIVRKRFVSKGVFKGPYVPLYGFGILVVYAVCAPLKAYPFLVFLIGVALCTAVEYLSALFLEKVFHIRGWDYRAYPFTKWCHYKNRIALTTSVLFGLVAVVSVYFYWDVGILLTRLISTEMLAAVDILFSVVFIADVIATGIRCIRNALAGIPNKTIGLE